MLTQGHRKACLDRSGSGRVAHVCVLASPASEVIRTLFAELLSKVSIQPGTEPNQSTPMIPSWGFCRRLAPCLVSVSAGRSSSVSLSLALPSPRFLQEHRIACEIGLYYILHITKQRNKNAFLRLLPALGELVGVLGSPERRFFKGGQTGSWVEPAFKPSRTEPGAWEVQFREQP